MLPWYKSAVPRASAGVWVVPFVQFYVFPRAKPEGIHKTALRVQIPYTLEVASFPGPLREFRTACDEHAGPGNEATLEAHGTTITCTMEDRRDQGF